MKQLTITFFIAAMFCLAACQQETTTPDPVVDDPDPTPRPLSKIEMLVKFWDIDTAYHDGIKDGSSTGKTIEFFNGGTYDFNKGDLSGSWEFTSDSSQLIIDKGKSYQQDWTIVDLQEERFEVDFNSPFTGKPSTWIMH